MKRWLLLMLFVNGVATKISTCKCKTQKALKNRERAILFCSFACNSLGYIHLSETLPC